MRYADGFVLVVPKKKLKAYLAMAQLASKVWMDHGALEYRECVADDVNVKFGIPFPKFAKIKRTETIVFAWIVYKSKAHRDKVNAKVMKDPRMNEMCDPSDMPFDPSKMTYGGFKVLVDL
ncbi:MAG: DUF1428 domain-containing protein [Pirellulaceae bacterium]|nr:DUF1428 domain-containing protein [Pirellulaceae bacterium]